MGIFSRDLAPGWGRSGKDSKKQQQLCHFLTIQSILACRGHGGSWRQGGKETESESQVHLERLEDRSPFEEFKRDLTLTVVQAQGAEKRQKNWGWKGGQGAAYSRTMLRSLDTPWETENWARLWWERTSGNSMENGSTGTKWETASELVHWSRNEKVVGVGKERTGETQDLLKSQGHRTWSLYLIYV